MDHVERAVLIAQYATGYEVVAEALNGIAVPQERDVVVRIEDDPTVVVDRHRMTQVLANLVVNAVRHGAGEITVRCFADGDTAVMHVTDEGGGVTSELEEEMFEAFVHGATRPDSSGLGLPIARAIVEAHGGTLIYISPDGDHAHQFVVTLPTAARG